MSYNTKNYTEQGGEKTVIGGTLEIKEGASVTGLPLSSVSAATASSLGGVKAAPKGAGDTVEVKIGADEKLYVPTYPTTVQLPYMADCTATELSDVVTGMNALLAAMKTAGLMAAEATD